MALSESPVSALKPEIFWTCVHAKLLLINSVFKFSLFFNFETRRVSNYSDTQHHDL